MKGNAGFPGQVLGTSLQTGKRETADIEAQGANIRDRVSVDRVSVEISR